MSAGGWSAAVSADLAARLSAAGVGSWGLRRVLGCSWVRAVGLLAGWWPWTLDEVVAVVGYLGVELYGVVGEA